MLQKTKRTTNQMMSNMKKNIRSAEEKSKLKRKSGATDPSKMYFTPETQEYIVKWQLEESKEIREKYYVEYIHPAIVALVDNLVNVHKFVSVRETVEEMKLECIEGLYQTLPKFNVDHGTTAFSYFNVVGKNWLIARYKTRSIKNRKQESLDDLENLSSEDKNTINEFLEKHEEQEKNWHNSEEISSNVLDFIKHCETVFTIPQERLVLEGIRYLFESCMSIDIINKTSSMFYLREYSGLNQKQLSNFLSKIKKEYKNHRSAILEIEEIENE